MVEDNAQSKKLRRRLFAFFFASSASSVSLDILIVARLISQNAPASVTVLAIAIANLSIFLAILPAGVFADIRSRQKTLIASQGVTLIAILVAAVAMLSGAISYDLALLIIFLNGLGNALRFPGTYAKVPSAAPMDRLSANLATMGLLGNSARALGPIIVGAITFMLGAGYVFIALTAFTLFGIYLSAKLPDQRNTSSAPLPAERFLGGFSLAIQQVLRNREFRAISLNGSLFFFFATPLFAFLPSQSQKFAGFEDWSYFALMAAFAGGAFLGVRIRAPLQKQFGLRAQVFISACFLAIGGAVFAFSEFIGIGLAATLFYGAGWLLSITLFSGQLQQSIPEWARARGTAFGQLATLGGVAASAIMWSQLAEFVPPNIAIIVSGAILVTITAVPFGLKFPDTRSDEVEAFRYWNPPEVEGDFDPSHGPVIVSIRYIVQPEKIEQFTRTMKATRQRRLRTGAMSWSLYRTAEHSNHFVELIVFENWHERLRYVDRTTKADFIARNQKVASLIEGQPAIVSNLIGHPI